MTPLLIPLVVSMVVMTCSGTGYRLGQTKTPISGPKTLSPPKINIKLWRGDPLELVKARGYKAPALLKAVRAEAGFPFLRGRKISALWVHIL